jgi:hypothetical protein
VLKQKCHPDRSAAQWRDLLFLFLLMRQALPVVVA